MEENVKAGANHMPCTWKPMSYVTLFTILFPFSALTLSFQIASDILQTGINSKCYVHVWELDAELEWRNSVTLLLADYTSSTK